jgi:hypothetical protein
MLAPSPSQHCDPIPCGLVSLWDMINFSLHSFYWQLRLLQQQVDFGEMPGSEAPISKDDQNTAEAFIAHAKQRSDEMGLTATAHRIRKMDLALKYQPLTRSKLADEYRFLIETIEGDIKDMHFYHYPKEKGLLVANVSVDWAKTLGAFKSAAADIEASVDCYALGHNRSSVYHSMMVLELGLASLAKRLKVRMKGDRATWGPIINNIREEIDRRRKHLATTPKGSTPRPARAAKAEKALLEGCEEAAIEFRYFTNVWRNHIAHGRGDYDENDAKKVMEQVRTFMEVISTKLRLKEVVTA